jgi:ribosomal protein S18 acetylase RimI-like enzyme
LDLNIRKARSADLRSIVDYYGTKGDSPFDPFANEDLLRQKVDLDDLIVAEVNGSFAGFVYFFVGDHPWFEPEVDRFGHILEVHVKSQYQGRGIATRMLEYAMEDLRKRNVSVIYIDTGANNVEALHLYEKMGFREFGRTIHFKKVIV